MKKKFNFRRSVMFLTLILTSFSSGIVSAQKATWIWYPGDYEIWLGNDLHNRRTERGTFFPPFWKMDSHYVMVEFSTSFELNEPETIHIFTEGRYNVKLDGQYQRGETSTLAIPSGKHILNIKIHNQAAVPALYVEGKTVYSGPHWKTTFEDKEWIDDSGKASDKSGTTYVPAGSWNFNSPDNLPSRFKLSTKPQPSVKTEKINKGVLVDFGKETMGFPYFHGVTGSGKLNIYYGESREEALDTKDGELTDEFLVDSTKTPELLLTDSKAFRYLYIETNGTLAFSNVDMLYEYNPIEYKGSFRCNDELVNKIWEIGAYTLHLTTREFFIDGIKRDRWVWSGDAYQSYLMNYYLFFDSPSVQRTLQLLRGKDPVTSHVNTIMDYTFYWFLGIYDYYIYTGDKAFIELMYPRMQSMMDYVLGRRNSRGLLQGLAGDWVFVDWSPKPMDKQGEVSFEQLLFARSLETMAVCADLLGNSSDQKKYANLASGVKSILLKEFWDPSRRVFVHNKVNGVSDGTVTRYTNMFAIFFDYLSAAQKQDVKKSVILNDQVMNITTPYMRFYELEAMCTMGETNYVLNEIRSYWGGMLKEGATTFWEKYDPKEKGAEHYAMYARPYRKSLCHAWGASPIYLLGKYFIGVKPTAPGYKEYMIEPNLGGLEWMEGSVPTPDGNIDVSCSLKEIKVKSSTNGTGTLRFKSQNKPVCKGVEIKQTGDNQYEMTIQKGQEYVVKYKSVE